MGRSVAQRLAAVRAAQSRADVFMSGADLDRQLGLLVAALGTPSKPGPPKLVTRDGVTRLQPGEPTPAVPPINTCVACQAWAQHLVAALPAVGAGPLRGVSAHPPCWGTHEEVA
jgi:hypothetical protein